MSKVADLYREQEAVEETFRDHISTVDKAGKRVWVYPKKPKGKFTNYRQLVSYFLLVFLFAGPFIKVDGQPFFLFNVLERKFILFGQAFWPQDFFLFVIGMIVMVVFVILFTVAFGRIFCGWICPQTIFMEGVFRRIEYWIEGDSSAQRKLDKMPWTKEKIRKKTLKHFLFICISTLIMHTFMAYLIGVDQTHLIIAEGPSEHMGAFVAMVVLTALFYGVFSKMREQVCTTICPYGRLQGVLLDRQSIVVAYDHRRGENRSRFKKGEDREAVGKGDCIDCKLCTYVCPTGIDIRNGTQLECINCTACMDACDAIMNRIGKPGGLVRYASEQNIADKKAFTFTTRMKAYSTVLTILVGVLVSLLIIRSDFETIVLRTPGMMFQKREDGFITNLYQLKMVNKTNEPIEVKLRLLQPEGEIEMIGKGELELMQQGVGEGAFFVAIDPENLSKMSSKISIGIYKGDELVEKVKTKFLGPAN
ncbi:MAG: cytochrome c oxidase accessory protein CcoG [Bacteroidota bacterium]